MNTRSIVAALALAAAACAPALSQPVTVFARLYVTPGHEAEAQARLEKLIAYVTEHEPGVVYQYYRDRSNPRSILTYEVYPSEEAVQRHVKEIVPAARAFAQAALGMPPADLWAKPAETQAAVPLLGR